MALIKESNDSLTIKVRRLQNISKREQFQKFQELCTKIIDYTPVLTGELRANYNIRYGLIPTVRPYIYGDIRALSPLPPAEFDLAFDPKTEEPMVIGSSVPYVNQIEFNSWSAKAPAGMINISIAEVYGVQ
jgi:hypothetical protein